MSVLQHFEVSETKEIYAAIEVEGACVVRGLLDDEFCDAILADFEKFLEPMPWGEDELGYKDDFYGSQTKRLHGLFSKSALMVDVLTHPFLTGLAKYFLTRDQRARDFRLSNAELMVLNQDQANQDFHTDGGSWHRIQQQEKHKEILISTNIALTEFTQTNGATRVVPGSHLWPQGRKPSADEVCLATMPKGAALLYSGNVIHSGGSNTTDARRVGLYLGYIVSWLRPIENQLVTNSPDDIFSLSAEAQQILDVVPGGFTVIA